MARLYSNENFPLPVVEELRRLGHDVLTVQEAGKANQKIPDDEVLLFARADERAVLTINRRDFIRLHRQQPSHSGIVVCTADLDFVRQAQRIHAVIEALPRLLYYARDKLKLFNAKTPSSPSKKRAVVTSLALCSWRAWRLGVASLIADRAQYNQLVRVNRPAR